MLVVIDSNEVSRDHTLQSQAWRLFALVHRQWNLSLIATEIIIKESCGNYARLATDTIKQMNSASRAARNLRISHHFDAARQEIETNVGNYESELRGSLERLGATVISPAQVDHMHMVERATTRRRPFNDKGEGYRDSLIWLTILEYAENETADDIILVSSDKTAFADATGNLHPQLLDELRERGIDKRITLIDSLQTLLIRESTRYGRPGDGITAIHQEVRREAVEATLIEKIKIDAPEIEVNKRKCALSPNVSSSQLSTVDDLTVSLTSESVDAEGHTLLNFHAELSAIITVEMASLIDLDAEEENIVSSSSVVSKPLVLSGVASLDQYDAVTGVVYGELRAPDEDPGHKVWRDRERLAQILRSIEWSKNIANLANVLKNSSLLSLQPTLDAFRQQQQGIAKSIQATAAFRPNPEILAAASRAAKSLEAFAGNWAKQNSHILENFQRPEFWDSVRAAQRALADAQAARQPDEIEDEDDGDSLAKDSNLNADHRQSDNGDMGDTATAPDEDSEHEE